jgi:predicted nucleotidyltransferase
MDKTTMTKTSKTDKTIITQETVNSVIVYLKKSLTEQGINVDGIALFGSALNGNMHEDSDIDLIVISKDFEGKDIFEQAGITGKAQWDTIRAFHVPMDILTMTPKEYERSKQIHFNSKIVV